MNKKKKMKLETYIMKLKEYMKFMRIIMKVYKNI